MIKELTVAGLLVLSLAGCSGEKDGTGDGAEATGAKSPQEALTQFTRHLYGGQMTKACALVTDGGKQAIASATGQGDCTAGIAEIIKNRSPEKLAEYKNWTFDEPDDLKIVGDTALYDGNCSGGPLHNIELNLTKTGPGWMISGWDDQIGYVCGG